MTEDEMWVLGAVLFACFACYCVGREHGARSMFALCEHVATGHNHRLYASDWTEIYKQLRDYRRRYPDAKAAPLPPQPNEMNLALWFQRD